MASDITRLNKRWQRWLWKQFHAFKKKWRSKEYKKTPRDEVRNKNWDRWLWVRYHIFKKKFKKTKVHSKKQLKRNKDWQKW